MRQSGFILTMELMLLLTILGIGLFVGIAAVRNALFEAWIERRGQEVLVLDASNNVLGRAVGFDQHEAPQIIFIDRDVPPVTATPAGAGNRNYRALLGVRRDRFTSAEPVYFSNDSCNLGVGAICVRQSGIVTEAAATGLANAPLSGSVAFLYDLQYGPTYAVGPTAAGTAQPGRLFRETAAPCTAAGGNDRIQSRWVSQRVTDAPAAGICERLCTPNPGGNCPGNSGLPFAGFRVATEVQVGGVNVLAIPDPPFSVTLPPDAGPFMSVAPGPEGLGPDPSPGFTTTDPGDEG